MRKLNANSLFDIPSSTAFRMEDLPAPVAMVDISMNYTHNCDLNTCLHRLLSMFLVRIALPSCDISKLDKRQLHVKSLLYYFTIPYAPPKFTSKLQLLKTLLNGFNHSKPLLQGGLRGMLNVFRTAIKCIKHREKVVIFILRLGKNFLLLSRAILSLGPKVVTA